MKLDSPEKIKILLEKNPNTSFIAEGGKQYDLINGEIRVIEPNHYHSWEYVKKIQNDLIGTAVEESWEDLNSQYGNVIDREMNTYQEGSPLETLASLWDFTFYPPPEIIASIAKTYNHYIKLRGEATLEEVFFGKPKKSLGTKSKRDGKKDILNQLDFLIRCDEINSRQIPQLQRAIEVIEFYKSSQDPETLLRRYRRSKKT